MRRVIALTAIVVATVAATYLVRGIGEPAGPGERPAASPGAIPAVPGLPSSGDSARERELDRLIGVFEDQVLVQPSTLDLNFLGNLYIQRGRLTGDLGTYAQAEEALTRALAIAPQDIESRSLLASVRFTVHDFAGALELGQGLLEDEPGNVGALAVVGDAHLELGHYDRAETIYSDLARRFPDSAAVQIRRARLAFLTGDMASASSLAAIAETSAATAGLGGPDIAWYRSFRAQLEMDAGRYGSAAHLYRSALRAAPDYRVALGGLAKTLGALGRIDEAIELYVRAIELLPDPSYVAALGDLYASVGKERLAREQYSTVEAIARLARASQQAYNRQLVTFYADHDAHLDRALTLARAELAVRRDIYGWDALAWVLYKRGNLDEARAASDRALHLGTPDAKLLYHSGMISMGLGDHATAERALTSALSLSPSFDPLQADEARDALDELRAA
jgi:tetratricopeptide (TPR) repeat protein